MKWLVLVIAGWVCFACGGAGGGDLGKPVALFPSKADLSGLAAGTAPSAKGAPGMTDVDHWQTQAPDLQQAQYPQETPWDKLALGTAQAHGASTSLSTALRCAAQEAARFYTLNQGMPDDGVREHLLLRCGSTLVGHAFGYVSNDVPDNVPTAQVEAAARPAIEKLLTQALQSSGTLVGLGVARNGGHFVAVVISGAPRAELHDFAPVVTGDRVTLSGTLRGSAEYLFALANQGPYGVARCENDATQRLPAFRLTCPLAAGDPATRIEIATKQAGRVLLEAVAQVEVRRDEHANPQYEAAAYGTNQTVASSAQFRAALFADLNRVRAAAGLRPFALESTQSTTDERLAPYLFQTLRSGDNQQMSTIALGLLAGWDVKGLIRDGGIFCRWVNTSRNPSRWLTQALDTPLGRWVLLEPGMSRIGIGASELQPSGEMAVVTTYAFFESANHQGDEETVLAELDRQRQAHGVAPAHRVTSDSALQKALRHVQDNTASSMGALNDVVQQASFTLQKDVGGYVVETSDVKLMKFDPMLLTASTLDLELGVTHYRAPGAAWGQYVVLFVVVGHGAPTREAKRGGVTQHF